MNYDSAEKQLSLAHPVAVPINHCHKKELICVVVLWSWLMGTYWAEVKGDTAQQCCAISLKVWRRKKSGLQSLHVVFIIDTGIPILYQHSSQAEDLLSLLFVWCCCVCCGSQKEMLHLDASCVAAVTCDRTVWIYSRQAVSVSPPCWFCIFVDCSERQMHLLPIYVSSHMSEGQMICYTCLPKRPATHLPADIMYW